MTYEIIADTAKTFGLRNKETGQIDHSGFASRAMIREFLDLHYGQKWSSQTARQRVGGTFGS